MHEQQLQLAAGSWSHVSNFSVWQRIEHGNALGMSHGTWPKTLSK